MGFEAINAFGHPTMLERPVESHARLLQLHSGPPLVRRGGAPTDEAINPLLEIDNGLLHGWLTIGCRVGQSKSRVPHHGVRRTEDERQ